ncbi:hypothetical protein [Burkholderia pseudomallei]|uniref:hypothetical protein n=1 Tax=Burkholderia pseudomallei TaxID=28450 RepID=UPI00053670E2|nr:hypothetical protein [Burkholderia pseudomallei]KGW50929.1 hypothetical protein Y049_2726 [Burkholderia pseudomallei MSHR684]OMW20875.1 hypothetical protein AQ806_12460 [Burkholderia pseudomallei]
MTVAELIAHLQAFPADHRVVVPHFERGYSYVIELDAVRIKLGTSDFGKGGHTDEIENMYEDEPFVADETAVVIRWG